MNSSNAKQIAERVISEFIPRWQQAPYAWLYELDIHAELAAVMRNEFQPILFTAQHDYESDKRFKFSSVSCRPYVKIEETDRTAIWPDIVIWANNSQHRDPYINHGHWPILWVCEIKSFFTGKLKREVESQRTDKLRLQRMIECGRAATAMQLVFIASRSPSPESVIKSQEKGVAVWTIYRNDDDANSA